MKKDKKYIVRVGGGDYIAEGKKHIVAGEPYVPITDRVSLAKRYNSYGMALKALRQKGTNMYGEIKIVEVDE